jgi:membrane-bound metal-dependent hydrolase YbcI (DUF457 family)
MPFTPYHFGPGAALHSLAPNRISFAGFCAANVLTDLEPLYHLLRNEGRVHGFFHTYVGATCTAAVTVGAFAVARRLGVRLPTFGPFREREIHLAAVAVGAAAGTWSHVLLDSIFHADIRPFAPFSAADPLAHALSHPVVQAGCVLSGCAGVLILAARQRLAQRAGA